MSSFEKDFGVEKIIRLEQNYRSHGHILDAANALIQNNKNRLGKNLWTDSELGDQIIVNECVDDTYEADWVVEEIKAFIQGMYHLPRLRFSIGVMRNPE